MSAAPPTSPVRAFAEAKQEASRHGGPKGALDAAFAEPVQIGTVRLPGSLSIGALIVLTEANSVFITGSTEAPSLAEVMEALYCCAEPKAARRAQQAGVLRGTALEWACEIPATAGPQLRQWLESVLAQVADANPSLPPEEAAPAPEAPAETTPPPAGPSH